MLVKNLVERKNAILKNAWITLFERRTIEQAAAVHVTSALEEEEIRKFGFQLPPCYQIPNGVDAPMNSPAAPREPDTLLFLGRLDWKKGLERLISAIALLDRARLIVAGNDEVGYTTRLKSLCKSLGVSHRVEFLGAVEGDEKWLLYRRAGAFVLPSYSENLANTVLEAMAMECPVVITPEVGLAPVVVEHRTGVVSSGDPGSLASAMREVLGDPDRARTMGRNGRSVVDRYFSWGEIAASMESAYQEILGAHRVRKYA
jgi:glycosyltransferase involved in cell wall biosynthesis